MLAIALGMILILALAGVVVAYVAFPHRGQQMPGVPWLGAAMHRAVDRLPTLDEDEQHPLHR
ncbi:MAG: hypothetical protein R2731_17200 [Nocardioides sp.]